MEESRQCRAMTGLVERVGSSVVWEHDMYVCTAIWGAG